MTTLKTAILSASTGLEAFDFLLSKFQQAQKPKTELEDDFYSLVGSKKDILAAINEAKQRDADFAALSKKEQLIKLMNDYKAVGDMESYNALAKELEQLTNELIPEDNQGDEDEVITVKGTKLKLRYAVVEAFDLIVSHDENGNANPLYPQELQPRDRGRETSQAWVAKTAKQLIPKKLGLIIEAGSGAPIIGDDLVVESGNGRSMAVIMAYKIKKADEYRDWLIANSKKLFGIPESKVKSIKHPILVAVRKTKVNREEFAVEANQEDKLAMTATEKARSDAKRLTDDLVNKLTEDGDLTSPANRDFIMGFMKSLGDTESAQYITSNGQPTKQLYDRIQAAIFSKAYNDDRLLELMADSAKPEIANIISALNASAPAFIRAGAISQIVTEDQTQKLTDSIELSLNQEAVNAIIGAANVIVDAKNKGLPVEELLKQDDIFGNGIDPSVAAMALFIKQNNRSAAKMGLAFKTMAEFVEHELENRQNASLFVDDPLIELKDVIKAANDELIKRYGGDDDTGVRGAKTVGGFIDIFTETRGQKKDREAFLANQNQPVSTSIPSHVYEAKLNGLIEFWDKQSGLAQTRKQGNYAMVNYSKYRELLKDFHNTGVMDSKVMEDIKIDIMGAKEVLKAVIKGDYDNETSENLLNIIENAAKSIDSVTNNDLISKAMDKWLEVDNRLYSDNVFNEKNDIQQSKAPNISDAKYKLPDGSIDLDAYDKDETDWYAAEEKRTGLSSYSVSQSDSEAIKKLKKAIENEEKLLNKYTNQKNFLMIPPSIRLEVLNKHNQKIDALKEQLDNLLNGNVLDDTSGIVGWFDNTDYPQFDEDENILDAARRLKYNPKTDHWVTTETGSHLLIRGGKVIGGAGGKLNGMRKDAPKEDKKISWDNNDKDISGIHKGKTGYMFSKKHNFELKATRAGLVVDGSDFIELPIDYPEKKLTRLMNNIVNDVDKRGLKNGEIDKILSDNGLYKEKGRWYLKDDLLDSENPTQNIAGWFDNTGVQ